MIFSCFGGMGVEGQRFYKRLAEMVAEKRGIDTSSLIIWLRTKLSFCLLKTALLCIRGSRSIKSISEPFTTTDIPVAVYEANIR